MPWCPICKSEYRKGFTRCKDCDVELVVQLESQEEQINSELGQIQFLENFADDMDAKFIESYLEAEGIPVTKSYREAGAYLNIIMGSSNFGVDLYVPESNYSQAKEILLSLSSNEKESNEFQNEQVKYTHKRRHRVGALAAYLYAPIAIVALYYLLKFILSIF